MADSDRNWQAWGRQDPYYAVLSDPRFRRDAIDGSRQDFFDSGRHYVDDVLDRLERHFGAIPAQRALDFGCGVGRLTLPLASRFASVVGVDISPAMLDEAQRNSAHLSIDYQLSDDSLSRIDGPFDFILSCIVLQHIPVKRGMPLIEMLLSRINPGGGCALHLSTRRRHDWRGRLRYFITHHMPAGQGLSNILRGRPIGSPVMQMNEYPLPDVIRLFHAHGFADLLLRYDDHGDCDTVMISGVKA